MPLVCLGLSHRTAPVEVRERHAFPSSKMVESLVALRDYEAVREAAMLSTCGRLEIYAELEDYEAGVAQLKKFLSNFRHGSVPYDMESYMYTLLGRGAIEHLFRVATGLDSMLIGEAEILGQVKDAYVQAQRAGSLGKTLHKLFREALNAGKAARSQTSIGDDSISVATAAIAMAKEHVGPLVGKTVAVIGAGRMGTTAAKRLRGEGATIEVLTRAHDGVLRRHALARADVAVTATSSPNFVLDCDVVAHAMSLRPERPLFIVDIAVPRDVDPEVAQIAGVAVADIDALSAVVDDTLEQRRRAVPFVEEIIDEYVKRFGEWYRSRVAIPIIASLTQRAESIREAEVQRLFARCPDLTEREKMLINGMSMTIVSRLLHNAVVRIRQTAVTNRAQALAQAKMLDELFDLGAVLPEFGGALSASVTAAGIDIE